MWSLHVIPSRWNWYQESHVLKSINKHICVMYMCEATQYLGTGSSAWHHNLIQDHTMSLLLSKICKSVKHTATKDNTHQNKSSRHKHKAPQRKVMILVMLLAECYLLQNMCQTTNVYNMPRRLCRYLGTGHWKLLVRRVGVAHTRVLAEYFIT